MFDAMSMFTGNDASIVARLQNRRYALDATLVIVIRVSLRITLCWWMSWILRSNRPQVPEEPVVRIHSFQDCRGLVALAHEGLGFSIVALFSTLVI